MKKPTVEELYHFLTEAIMNEYPPETSQIEVEVLVEALEIILTTTKLAAEKYNDDDNGSTH